MTTCISFAFHYFRPKYYSSSSYVLDELVWKDEDGSFHSEVGIDGKLEVRKDLRQSKTIRQNYVINCPEAIKIFFTAFHVGVGNKNIYYEGNFMKEHFDSRRPDKIIQEKSFPHIMTLIVTNDVDCLKVNGKPVPAPLNENQGGNSIRYVLFTLNCPHEVLPFQPTKWGEKCRVSYTFPVYGEYNPVVSISKKMEIHKNAETLKDVVLEKVNRAIESVKNGNGKKVEWSQLHGYVKVFPEIDGIMKRVRQIEDYYYDAFSMPEDMTSYFEYDFVSAKTRYHGYSSSIIFQPLADNPIEKITVQSVSETLNLLLNLQTKIQEFKEKEENDDASVMRLEDFKFPETIFTLTLSERYYVDSKLEHLSKQDKMAYDLFSKTRKVKFVPVSQKMDDIPNWYLTRDGKISETQVGPFYTTDFYVEFDDGSEYDPRYNLVSAVLVVE